jgi:predicted DNA-binding transcriptional regulator AlpA
MTRRTIAERVTANPPVFGLSEQTEHTLLLDEKKAAAFLGVSLPFLRRGRSEGKTGHRTQTPPFVRVGGRVYYRRSDLSEWVSALTSQEVN